MVTFSQLEHKGNLGNQLFQIASVIGIASLNKTDFIFPKWKYANYFKNHLPFYENGSEFDFIKINEENSTFQNFSLNSSYNYDINGWLQSEKYFNINKTKYFFQFNENKVEELKGKYKSQFKNKTILISIRRGDFVDHPDFYQLSIKYYINALIKYFPKWKDFSIFVFSDDINYCKYHFGYFNNCTFSDNLNVVEQLILASFCDNFIISNSTFSWWSAWLGEKEKSTIIRPNFNFTESKRLLNDDIDFFPERWIKFNHENEKLIIYNSTLFINNNSSLKKYYDNYFIFEKSNEVEVVVEVNDYIIPPLVLFEMLQKKYSSNLYYNNICYINSNKENKLFLNQLDFGYFSSIFKFKKNNKKKIACVIKNIKSKKISNSNIEIVGKINDFKGNKFLYKRFKLYVIKKIKLFIKYNFPKVIVKTIKKN